MCLFHIGVSPLVLPNPVSNHLIFKIFMQQISIHRIYIHIRICVFLYTAVSVKRITLKRTVNTFGGNGVFPEEEGEEESPLEEDDVVWTPFLGANPLTEIELEFGDLYLVESSHDITEPLQQVLGSTIDAYKWALVKHLDEVFRFQVAETTFSILAVYQPWFNLAEGII